MREQWRALKDAGALLADHDVRRLGAELVIDAVTVGGNEGLAARRLRARRPVLGMGVLGAVEDRDAGAPRGGQESLSRTDCAMGIDAAGIGIAPVELIGRVRSTAIDELIEVDREQRRMLAHEGLAPPAGIKLKIRFRNDATPAMVVELLDGCHSRLPLSVAVTEAAILAHALPNSQLRTGLSLGRSGVRERPSVSALPNKETATLQRQVPSDR